MIRTLQKKFTVTAMIAVTVLLAVLLGVINAVNALSQQPAPGPARLHAGAADRGSAHGGTLLHRPV